MHLLRQRLELDGIGAIGQRIVLLLVEELRALRVHHSRRLLRAEHRIGIDLHALPGRRIGNVVGVPPLHLEIGERGADAPGHGDAVAGHLAGAGRARVQPVGIAGRQHDGARQHDDVFATDVVEREHAADRAIRPRQQRGDRGFLETGNTGLEHLLAAQVHERHA
jgi:hypothetical protein